MSNADRSEEPPKDILFDQASRSTLALNPLIGLRGEDLFDSARIVLKAMVNEPKVAAIGESQRLPLRCHSTTSSSRARQALARSSCEPLPTVSRR
jgi:hypothetical protein